MRTSLPVFIVLALGAVELSARSHRQLRRGFTAAFGFASAHAGVSCDGCTSTGRQGGTGGRLMLAGRR
jgi:hypothetical protein